MSHNICVNGVKILFIIFHSAYAVKGYYRNLAWWERNKRHEQKARAPCCSWTLDHLSLNYNLLFWCYVKLLNSCISEQVGRKENPKQNQKTKNKSHLSCLATIELGTFRFSICQEAKLWAAIQHLGMIVMMFNSLLHNVVTMATNNSDLVKPKLL